MVELIIAVAVSTLIVIASMIFLRYMITVADDNRDKTMATLEVQYVGFWISEDVAQAQTINVGNISGDVDGFPLILTWAEWDGSQSTTIIYDVEPMEDGDQWRLMRTYEFYQGGYLVESGTSQIAEYLIPWSDVEDIGTKCCRMVYDAAEYGNMKSMIVEVAARADRSEASSMYEIYPRTVVEWLPQDDDGNYIGPECPVS
jgi:hypothetical protein